MLHVLHSWFGTGNAAPLKQVTSTLFPMAALMLNAADPQLVARCQELRPAF
jgi:hypothetical protein